MREIALIDADIVAFRCAAASENNPQDIAEVRTNEMMQKILHDIGASSYKAFLTGSNNFRKKIYPEYKANRKDKPRPQWLQACRDLLVTQWNAEITDGYEADDALGMAQDELGTVICSVDKDLLQIPGCHYNFVKQEAKFVSIPDGIRSFYKQLITGDASDNIPAFDGKFRGSIPKFVQKLLDPIDNMFDEYEMYEYCENIYSDQVSWADDWSSILERNAKCLYIMKKENDYWQPPEKSGLREDGMPSL